MFVLSSPLFGRIAEVFSERNLGDVIPEVLPTPQSGVGDFIF
jgi:hypothetical protein